MLFIDPKLLDELSGKELKLLLQLVREVVLRGNEAPGNDELATGIGLTLKTMKKLRSSLEDKGFMLRRDPQAGKRSDYKIITNRVGALVGAAEGQRRVENPTSSPDQIGVLSDWIIQIKTNREFHGQASRRWGLSVERVFALIDVFLEDKRAIGEDNWTSYTAFRKNFYFWLKYQDDGNSKQKKTVHDNGQIISTGDAHSILDDLSRNG